MRTRLLGVFLAVSLAAACAPSPATTGGPGASGGASTPGGGSGTGAFVRLDWTAADASIIASAVPEASVLVSGRGTLLRGMASPDATELTVRVSTDGSTWVTTAGPLDAPMGTAIDGAADWLQAVAEDRPGVDRRVDLLASTDGVTWTRRGSLPAELASVQRSAVRGRAIVACGDRRAEGSTVPLCAASTDDGATWQLLPELDAFLAEGELLGVAATDRGFLIVMEGTRLQSATIRAATSGDGLAWVIGTEAPGVADLSPEIAPRLGSVGSVVVLAGTVFDGSEFVRAIWTTPDGRVWTRVALPRIVAWRGDPMRAGAALVVPADNGTPLAAGALALLVSGDGRAWRAEALPSAFDGTTLDAWAVIPMPGGLLAVNTELGLAMTARPVATADPGPTAAPPTPTPSASASREPGGPTLAWSVGDPVAEGRPTDVVAWGGGFVAVGSVDDGLGHAGAVAWWSPDGLSWRRTLAPEVFPNTRMTAVATDGEVLVAAGLETIPGGRGETSPIAAFWRSIDGRTWERNAPSPDLVIGIEAGSDGWAAGLNDVIAGGPGFVAVGATRADGATVWASPDGLAWAPVAALGFAAISRVAASGSLLVAVGATGGPASEGRTWTSADGIAWEAGPGNAAVAVSEVASGGVSPVLVGAGWGPAAWWSMDGVSWRQAPDQEALRRRINDEGITALGGTEWGFVGAGTAACPGSLDACAATWESPDGITWGRWLLPSSAPASVECPTCAVTPVAIAVADARVVVVGAVGFYPTQGWASWAGTPRP